MTATIRGPLRRTQRDATGGDAPEALAHVELLVVVHH